MRPEEALTPSELELANALAGLRPGSKGIDRKRLMYEAGRRSMRRHLLAWRGISLLLCVGLGLSWTFWPAARSTGRIEYVSSQAEQPEVIGPSADRSGTHYLELQRRVLAEGLDVLASDRSPSTHRVPGQPTLDELVHELFYGT